MQHTSRIENERQSSGLEPANKNTQAVVFSGQVTSRAKGKQAAKELLADIKALHKTHEQIVKRFGGKAEEGIGLTLLTAHLKDMVVGKTNDLVGISELLAVQSDMQGLTQFIGRTQGAANLSTQSDESRKTKAVADSYKQLLQEYKSFVTKLTENRHVFSSYDRTDQPSR